MKRVLLMIGLLVVSLTVVADEQPDSTATVAPARKLSLLRRIIRGFDRLDTNYIEPQHYNFTVMAQGIYAYDIYTLSSRGHDAQSITFTPDADLKVGPYFGWKWIFAGYTFDLSHLSLRDNKQEFVFSIYSSQIGLDLFYRRTGSDYKLRDAKLGADVNSSALQNVSFDGLSAGITGFNLYYIFNHGRFSYPAAFAQSTCQKISCGSWMAGIGYTRNSLSLDYEKLQQLVSERTGVQHVPLDSGLMFQSVSYTDVNVSAGYAYNWVFARNWLFGASAQLAIAHKHSSGDVAGDSRDDFSFRNFNLDGIGRFGLVYNNTRWYAGVSAIVHTYNYRKSRFKANNTFGSLNIYVGYNFGLKKKYREEQ